MSLVVGDRIKETTSTTGTGTLTLAGAVIGCQAFSYIGNGNTTYYTLLDANGTGWEVGIGTYTLSGTTLARTTILASTNSNSAITLSAGTHTVFAGLPATPVTGQLLIDANIVAGTDAAVTMVANTIYVVDMSAWATSDRIYTCPTSPQSIGNRIRIIIQAGNASFELIIKGNTSQTINGGSAASEWSRLFITGESVTLLYVASNAWIVEEDGRIPIKVYALRAAAQSMLQNVAFHPNWDTITVDNSGGFNNAGANAYFNLRRAGLFWVASEVLGPANGSLTTPVGIYSDIISDPNGTPVYYGQSMRSVNPQISGRTAASRSTLISVPVNTGITAEYIQDGATGNIAGAEISIVEQLP